MKRMMLFTISLILLVLLGWQAPSNAQETQLTIGASGTASSQYPYWVAVAQAIKKNAPGIMPTVIETGGVLDNVQRLIRKQVDFCLAQGITAYEGYYGKGQWEGKPHPELRWFWHQGNSAMAIFVREDSGIKSIYDLNGKKFCAGARGSGGEKVMQGIFDLLGIKPDYYRGDYSDAAEAVQNRQIMGFAKWSNTVKAGDALVVQISVTTKLNFLSIPKEDLEKVKKKFPYIGVGSYPPNVYKGQNYEVSTIMAPGGAVTSAALSQDLGYRICQGVWKGKEGIETAFPGAKEFHMFKDAVAFSPLPLHAGTIKVCKELGIEVPQHLVPPEYK